MKPISQRDESTAILRKMLRPGTTVYTGCPHVSRSGMSRQITCHVVRHGEITDITWHVGNATGTRPKDTRAHGWVLRIDGCGMDMGLDVVHRLSYVLHGRDPKGEAVSDDERGRPFAPRPGHYRPGYSLNHRWL